VSFSSSTWKEAKKSQVILYYRFFFIVDIKINKKKSSIYRVSSYLSRTWKNGKKNFSFFFFGVFVNLITHSSHVLFLLMTWPTRNVCVTNIWKYLAYTLARSIKCNRTRITSMKSLRNLFHLVHRTNVVDSSRIKRERKREKEWWWCLLFSHPLLYYYNINRVRTTMYMW